MIEISLIQADITTLQVDAIVNAANAALQGGGGVDGAIHQRGGAVILAECQEIIKRQGLCATGQAVLTSAGNLSAKYVIHTVGPIWQADQPQQAQQLAACYRHSLALADAQQCQSIAFPNISTGVYHYPKIAAAKIAIHTVRAELCKLQSIRHIYFVCYDAQNFSIYQQLLQD